MSLSALRTSVDRLTTAVDRVVSLPGGGTGATDQELADEAARIDFESQRLEAIPGPTESRPTVAAPPPRHK